MEPYRNAQSRRARTNGHWSTGPNIDEGSSPRLPHLALLAIGLTVLYGLTASWGVTVNRDAVGAALPAWSIAVHGSWTLPPGADANMWIQETRHGLVSNRAPGLIAIAIPAYLVTQPAQFSNAPATGTAVVTTVAAMLVLYAVLCRVARPTTALVATVVVALGTSTWTTSASSLWPHGPGQLWAALSLLLLAQQRYSRAGWVLGLALVTRPLTAVSSGVMGLMEGVQKRSWRITAAVAVGVSVSLALLLGYNYYVFGGVSVTGGYSPEFTNRLTNQSSSTHLANTFGFLFSPTNGIFVWTPVALLGVVGLVMVWRSAPTWVRSACLGAVIYIVIHARLNRVSGGVPIGYRYPLEPLTLAMPGLTLGAVHLWNHSPRMRWLVGSTAILAIALHALLAVAWGCAESSLADEITCGLFL